MRTLKNLLLLLFLITPILIAAQLTYPTRYPTAVIPHPTGGHIEFFGYAPMVYKPATGGAKDTFKLYYINTAKIRRYARFLARSTNYGISWNDTTVINADVDSTLLYEALVQNPDSTRIYMGYHRWFGKDTSWFYKAYSTDGGYTFIDTGRVMRLGEDKSFIWNEDTHEYWGYVRPRNVEPSCINKVNNVYVGNGFRKIALMKNNNFFPNLNDWSARDTILAIDPTEYNDSITPSPDFRTQVYYMQVFRSGSDWWGLVGMYRVANNGGVNNPPPYTAPEYTSDVELVWSENGEDWYRTNSRSPFIALHDSIHTIYAVGTLVNDSVYFYSEESTLFHGSYRTPDGCYSSVDNSLVNGRFYSIYLYKISVSNLNEWKPPSIVLLKVGVEGFLNPSLNKHVLRDTLWAELRSSTTPYGIESTVKAVIDSSTLTGTFNLPHVIPGNYFLTIEGRNSLETWSNSTISISTVSPTSYNFTTSSLTAYGGNLDSIGSTWCIYSGDVNNDNIVDVTDELAIYNDVTNVVTGYVDTDLTGDYIVDSSDILLAFNNSNAIVSTIAP